MVRTVWRLRSVAAGSLVCAGLATAGAQQVTAPTPPRTDLVPRMSAVAAPAASGTSRPYGVNPAMLSPHPMETGRVVEFPVGVRRIAPAPVPAGDKASPAPAPAETRRNQAMMMVGGAALIVGAVLPDPGRPLVMTAGALVGLYGLYKYLE